MLRILRYEFLTFFKGNKARTFFISLVISALLFIGLSYANNIKDGVSALGDGLGFYVSLITFFAPVFAGMTLSQQFEERLVQNMIMNGKKRIDIVIAKFLFYFLMCTIFISIPLILSTVILTLLKGWNLSGETIKFGYMLLNIIAFIMLASVAYAIVIPINFKIKKVGPSIGLGLLLSLVLYSANQELIKKTEYHKFLKYTPLG